MTTFQEIRKRLEAATPGLKTVERLDDHCEESFRYEINDDEHLVAFYEDNHKQPMRAKFNAELYAHATTDIATLLEAVDVLTETLRAIQLHHAHPLKDKNWAYYAHELSVKALARVEEMGRV